MGFACWITTKIPIALDTLGDALAEIAPELSVGGDFSHGIDALPGYSYVLRLGDDPITVSPGVLSVAEEDGGTHITFSPSRDVGGWAAALAIAAAALHAGGGSYGDDAGSELKGKKVLAEYKRALKDAGADWSRMDPDERAAIVATAQREALLARAKVAAQPGFR